MATIRSTVQQEEPHAPIRARAAADAVDVGVAVDPGWVSCCVCNVNRISQGNRKSDLPGGVRILSNLSRLAAG